MQYQVPQFIDTEDKIAGPFTIRQFIYISITAALIFAIYFIFQSFIFFGFSIVIGAIGVSFAFIKVNGQKLSKLAVLGFLYYWNPQLYLWQAGKQKLPKTKAAMKKVSGNAINLESIISGSTLKKAVQYVQTGSKQQPKKVVEQTSRYQVFRQVTGELRAARRVDYST